MAKCFPDHLTYVVVMTEFLKQDCRQSGHTYHSLASHLPRAWRDHVLSDPCTSVDKKDVNDKLNRYVQIYFANPCTIWNTELQAKADRLQKYYVE